MEPIILIHGYSSESWGNKKDDIAKIYGTLPDDLTKLPSGGAVVPVSRYTIFRLMTA